MRRRSKYLEAYLENTILIQNDNGIIKIGRYGRDEEIVDLKYDITMRAHKRADDDKISLMEAFKLEIKRSGYIPQEI